jgi:hypothetical protein
MIKIISRLILLLFLFFPLTTSAHEVKHSGSLAILLHMEPLDDPPAGEPAGIYFSVEDSNNKFQFENCDCIVTVKDINNKVLFSRKTVIQDLAPDWGINVVRLNVTFPTIGVYNVSIQGKSLNNSFSDFNLEYDKRIERQTADDPYTQKAGAQDNDFSRVYYYLIGGIVIIVAIILYIKSKKLRK